MSILLRNAYIALPHGDSCPIRDIYIEDGVIAEIGSGLEPENFPPAVVYDFAGMYIFPGLVDIHVHLRDPGYEYKEDIHSGAEAAAAGGFTAVACMPNTDPVTDNPDTIAYISKKAQTAKCRVYPIVAITQSMQGEVLCDYAALKQAGAVAVSDDGRPVAKVSLMRKAMIQAAGLGLPIISHCEDLAIAEDGIIHDGRISAMLDIPGIDRASEESITAREILLAETSGTAVHIAHVSTEGSVELIRSAKARGVRVTAETCPHYFSLTHDLLLQKDADYRMNPPLREQTDVDAVISALADGTIDCIVTDHAPHSPDEKKDFLAAPNGIVGLETSFGCAIEFLHYDMKMSLNKIARLMSSAGAEILGIPHCRFKKGDPADIAVADIKRRWTVEPERFRSKSRNTPFKGMTLTGRIVMTIKGGEVVYRAEN
ncbi:MAG: dihydroorotase [Oscillospiraceae bacterium]|nr:dihydroorotase [Oscillospiraceae bacterium]